MLTSRVSYVLYVAATLAVVCATARADAVIEHEQRRSALALELRLLAPCCWVQTLDVHESELATALRGEIAERIARGERSDSIEDDLAARYGERIRAVPRGADPRDAVPLTVGIGMLVSAVLLVLLALAWRRRAHVSVVTAVPAELDDAHYAQRIAEELQQL